METRARLISARTGRTLYNLADALHPPRGEVPGAADVDLVPALERALRVRGPGAVRRFWCVLLAVEWLPVLHPGVHRPFWRLPRERRMELLGRWRRGLWPVPGARLRWVETLVDEAWTEARRAAAPAGADAPQSDAGA
jgi:hypothetical protein